MSSKIARKHTRRWLDGQPSWVVFAIAALAVLPVLVWLAHPEAAGYPDAIATVVGIVLTALVFMLTAAQNAQKRALDTVVSEFAARDERVRKAAAGDDPEPWPAQMNHELRYVDTVAAIASRPVQAAAGTGAASSSTGRRVRPASVSMASPSRAQYSKPPMSSRTWR